MHLPPARLPSVEMDQIVLTSLTLEISRGVEKVIENDKAKGEIFNLTYGSGRTLAEMAEIVKSHFPEIQIKYQLKDKLTPDRGTLNINKARN